VSGRFRIETLEGGAWIADAIGDSNEFATRAEAERAIDALRVLGDEWATAVYCVAEVQS
jgi:hypothetical protein